MNYSRNLLCRLVFLALLIVSMPKASWAFLDTILQMTNNTQQPSATPQQALVLERNEAIKQIVQNIDLPFGDMKAAVLLEVGKSTIEEPSVTQNLDRLLIASDCLDIGETMMGKLQISADARWPQAIVSKGPNLGEILQNLEDQGYYDLTRDFLKISPVRIFSTNVNQQLYTTNNKGVRKLIKVKAVSGNAYKSILSAAISFATDPIAAEKAIDEYDNALNLYNQAKLRHEKYKADFEANKRSPQEVMKMTKEERSQNSEFEKQQRAEIKHLEDIMDEAEDVFDDWKDKVYDHLDTIEDNPAFDPRDKANLNLAKNIYSASKLVAELDLSAVAVLGVAVAKTPGSMLGLQKEMQELSQLAMSQDRISQSVAKKKLKRLENIGKSLPESIAKVFSELGPQGYLALHIADVFSDKFGITAIDNLSGGIDIVLKEEKEAYEARLKELKKEIAVSKEEIEINKAKVKVYKDATGKSEIKKVTTRGDCFVILEHREPEKSGGQYHWCRVARNDAKGGEAWIWSENGVIQPKGTTKKSESASSSLNPFSLFN